MPYIKFSHDYNKLPAYNWDGQEALLVGVCRVKIANMEGLSPEFLKYDTRIRKTMIDQEIDFFPLDFEDALILSFIHLKSGAPFTTIRRHTEEKADYYRGSLGRLFFMKYTGEARK